MKDKEKTKKQLLEEVEVLRKQLAKLKKAETKRRGVEETLQRTNERLNYLLTSTSAAIYTAKTSGDYGATSVTENIKQMTGYAPRGFIENSGFWIDHVYPEDRERILNELPRIFEQETYTYEYRFLHRDGHCRWVRDDMKLVRGKLGNPVEIIGYWIDITDCKQAEEALRESEERYQTILEDIEEGYFETDLAGRATFINDSLCKIYGYSREEFLGMDSRRFADKENAKKVFEAFNRVYRTGEPGRLFNYEIIRKDGTKRQVEVITSLRKDSSGNPIGFRGITRDVTEREQAEEKMESLQEQLRQPQKMEAIGRLAGGIAHDFNNLLTVIKGYSQLSPLEFKEDTPLRGNIEQIHRATDRATDLVRQLLAFSRRQILEMKVLDLNAILKNLHNMLRRVIGEDIELITVLAEDLGRIRTDPGWIEQAIMNLVVNARDAMASGEKLTIKTENVDLDEAYLAGNVVLGPGGYVLLSISDTGVGMTPKVMERLFEPFFSTKEKDKGTGLGLSTVYGIVKQSGGDISVYSEPGKGTTFRIYPPRVDGPLDELKEKLSGDKLLRGRETILLVEDEEDLRKLAVIVLERQGYSVLSARNGDEALLISEQHENPIHLMLTDVVMPGMNGRELAKRLEPSHPETKVLYMSGYTDHAIVTHGVLAEGVHYIQKPFTVEALAKK